MNLFCIKLGKALSAVKNDGFFVALKRICVGVWAIIKPVGSGRILFISGGMGDSARYRTKNVAEFLKNNAIKACVTVQGRPFLSRYVHAFEVFVFHRVMYTPEIQNIVEQSKALGKTLIFETDDLVFDEEYLKHMDVLKNMNSLERKQYETGVGAELLKDSYVQIATTTTSFLAKKLQEKGKKVFIVPNMLSQKDLNWAHSILKKKKKNLKKDSFVYVGYFSGSKSHDKDFNSIAPVMIRILKKYPFVRLVIAGPLLLGDEFFPFSERIDRLPFASRKKHFENISQIDINIAPLEKGNPFCEGKSELKFFEAGIVNIPTIASSTQTFREAIEHKKDGFVAENEEEWEEYISDLVEDRKLRYHVGREAKKTALERYTTLSSSVARDYIHYFESM
ncbi:MAG: glycosyltransferase [Candidatus Moraniibacteriota bacterium]|nr:MAG: glycosyltransferase [Candidatus Moranbacteria bacterium]